jgi:hypothetical protein
VPQLHLERGHRLRSPEDFVPGIYLTDGCRLFRVVSRLARKGEYALSSLEDCLTLDVTSYSADELFAMRLHLVVAAGELAPT